MVSAFLRKWRHRTDFLVRETAYEARGLASLLAALAFASAGKGPILILVAAPAQARFLSRIAPRLCRASCDVRVVADLATLDRCLSDVEGQPIRVLLAGELYARFHARLAAAVRAGTLAVA
jgi:hypothetical protein